MKNIKSSLLFCACACTVFISMLPVNSSVASHLLEQNSETYGADTNSVSRVAPVPVYPSVATAPVTTDLFAVVRAELGKVEYAQDQLPNDFSYLNQLLVHGKNMTPVQRREYGRSVFSIFSKVLGGSLYVNAYAYGHLLEVLPAALNPYFMNNKVGDIQQNSVYDTDAFDRFKASVFNTLYLKFSTHYETFKTSPVHFFDDVSAQITAIAKQEMDTMQMRIATKRFLELALHKLVWDYEDHTKIWHNVKNIAEQLSLLIENGIFEDLDDLDDMYWTLIHRFNYFIDLVGPQMPSSFYYEIKKDIAENELLLLTLEEQDICIQTKRDCLTYALLAAEAKSLAYARGILTS